ncbi:hypothetical protein HY495_01870 [Candidatus Woesearchaeota archaeon]|nr:hypothetical protein [Candidatus Woesearchaeota archaeon]
MRFTPQKIEEILVTLLGPEGTPLVRELIGKANVSEFDLAVKTKKDIKIIRKQLYILHNYNLVGFTRKKDKQKGWYIYYWTLLPENIKFNDYKMKRNLLEKLKMQLEEEKKELFFVCPTTCVRLNFDQAMDFEFRCPECGELLNQDQPEERVKQLQKKIDGLEAEFMDLKQEHKKKKKQGKERKKVVKAKKKAVQKKRSSKQKPVKPKTKKRENIVKKIRKIVKKKR